MMIKEFHKLVRDHIPALIQKEGAVPHTRTLSHQEFLDELDRKLNEEVAEYQESKDLEELADILEVVFAISEARGGSKEELLQICAKKREQRGGFSKRIFLISKDTNCQSDKENNQ